LNKYDFTINDFKENGFVIIKNFFNEIELNDFQESLVKLIKITLEKLSKKYPDINIDNFDGKELDEGILKLEETDADFVSDIYDIIPTMPSFMRLTAKRELSELINIIFGREKTSPLYTFTNRCRVDPPFISRKSTKWHQEIFYTIPKSNFIQTWSPLIRDITKNNGSLEVCLQSHKGGIAKQSYCLEKDNPNAFNIDQAVIDKYKKTTIELKLGDLMIFSPNLFHRSGPNISNQVRYTNIGMFHNIDYPTFRPPQPTFTYKYSSPAKYYSEVFRTQKI
jgi:phytanoyl-CoA hydroxylase